MLVRRSWLETLPWHSPIFAERTYDMVLSISAAATGGLVFLDEVLVKQRRHAEALTYTSMKSSMPSIGNGFRMLYWCLKHYRRIKERTRGAFHSMEQLLQDLNAPDTPVNRDALKMLRLLQSASPVAFFRFQTLCLKHCSELSHTPSKGMKNRLHAFLYPFLMCWYSRYLIEESKN